MSSIPLIGRFIKRAPSSSVTQSPQDRTISPPSSTSFHAPENKTSPRPKVNIPKEAFPFYTQVSWPPNSSKSKPAPTQPTTPAAAAAVTIQPTPAAPVVLIKSQATHSNVPPVLESQPSPVINHPETLIPASRSSTAPRLIDMPIDVGPALNDDMFSPKSDSDGSRKSVNAKTSKSSFQGFLHESPNEHFTFPDKSVDQQVFSVPIGQHFKNGQRPSSPSIYSESSSTFSYVSAPELEYGDDDLYGASSPRSHRLTRKDSTTLPQDWVWHLLNNGPRNRDDDDAGKRSIKSRRNSDGGASIHTTRRSKSNSRADTFDSSHSRSRSRPVKSKHTRTSGASVSSSTLSPAAGPSTPSTILPSSIVNGQRTSVFPSPMEPMPAHAIETVQAVQAMVDKEISNPNPNFKLDKIPAQPEKKLPNPPRNANTNKALVPPMTTQANKLSVSESSYARSSFMEYSPSNEVTFADALTGYNLPRTVQGSSNLPHAYANSSQSNSALASTSWIEASLPSMPRDSLAGAPPPRLPSKTKPRGDHPSMKKSSPPVLPLPISHDKSQSDSFYPEILGKNGVEKRTRSSHSHFSKSTRPRPSPSRPLPTRPPVVPEVPVAGPSKPIKRVKASSPRLSSADRTSRKTIESDKTIKPIGRPSNGVSIANTTNHFNDVAPSVLSQQDGSSPHSEPPIERKSEEKIREGDLESNHILKTGSEAILQVLTRSSSSAVQPPASGMASATSSTTSPLSSSSLPVSSSNVTTEDLAEQSSLTHSDDLANCANCADTLQKEESRPEGTEVARSEPLPSHESPNETQDPLKKDATNHQKLGNGDLSYGQSDKLEDLTKDDGDHRVPEPKDNLEVSKGSRTEHSSVDTGVITEVKAPALQDNLIPLPQSHANSETSVDGSTVEVLQEKKYLQKEVQASVTEDIPVDHLPAKVEGVGTVANASSLPNREDLPSSESIDCPKSPPKEQDLNMATNELRKSIHDSSAASIPWNSSTGSIGSHRLKNQNSSLSASSFLEDAKSLRRKQTTFNVSHTQGFSQEINEKQNTSSVGPSFVHPEQYPLPPSMSSVELPFPFEDHKVSNDSNRPTDGRTASSNAPIRTRPFSPNGSMQSFSSQKVVHKPNRSVGDVSQAASGLSEAPKISSLPNQCPPFHTSSPNFQMNNGVTTRTNRSSTLPIVDGISPAPVPSSQNNRSSKTTLPIGGKPSMNESMQQSTRQRSGSEPHPNMFHHRAAGRLSTIQQSPIQQQQQQQQQQHYPRPNALPLRRERQVGSMTFPETPHEYTPMTTPGINHVASPHIRGASSTSNNNNNDRRRKNSRIGSEVSIRRPIGPRPPRNVSNTNNARNVSSRFASPPNTARSFDSDPVPDGSALPDFRPRPVEWRPYTLEAAQWTFTSEQLQEIVGCAIRQSAIPSTIRLLTLNALDEIKPEIERLEILQQDVTIRYCTNVTRRRVILKSLRHHIMDTDWTKRSQLLQELNDTSYLADQLTKDLFHTMYRLQQLYRLIDVHNGSALAMALRKLNSSFVKQLDDLTQLSRYVAQSEEEKEEAWATAERFEREAMELREKLEALSIASPESENSSRRSSARKPSVRASKASFRLSRSTRLSRASSTSSGNYYPFAPPPPVPPIPRLAQTSNNNSRVLSLNTDVSAGAHSIQSAQSFAFSPTPEALALDKVQRELYDLLGLPRKPRKSVPTRQRPLSEILSPATASDGRISPYKLADHHPLRRNNSIPISPYVISETFRD